MIHFAVFAAAYAKTASAAAVVPLLQAHGANINAADMVIIGRVFIGVRATDYVVQRGFTPLHTAALQCNCEMVQVLMMHGADITKRNRVCIVVRPASPHTCALQYRDTPIDLARHNRYAMVCIVAR